MSQENVKVASSAADSALKNGKNRVRPSRGAPKFTKGEMRRVLKEQKLRWDTAMLAESDPLNCAPASADSYAGSPPLDFSAAPDVKQRIASDRALEMERATPDKLIALGKTKKEPRRSVAEAVRAVKMRDRGVLSMLDGLLEEEGGEALDTELDELAANLEQELLGGGGDGVEDDDDEDEDGDDDDDEEAETEEFDEESAAGSKRKRAEKPSAAAAPKKRGGKRRKNAEPPIEPVQFDSEIESTYDAETLLKHMATRLCDYEKRCSELSKLYTVLNVQGEEMHKLHAPIAAYLQATSGAARRAKCDTALRRVLDMMNKDTKRVNVLMRAQTSCAIEIKRLCVLVESLIYNQLGAHDARRMPGSRRAMVMPVFADVGLTGVDSTKVLRRKHPPPLRTAIDAEHDISRDGKASLVRVVRAAPPIADRRPSSWLPSWRPSLITVSTARQHWAQQDTATAAALTRARTTSEALRERRAARVVGLLGDGRSGSVISATVPQLSECTTELYKQIQHDLKPRPDEQST